MSGAHLRPAVFVDRDGTLTIEGEWVRHPGALALVDGAGSAVRALHRAGYLVILYSNQSAVARGLITEEELSAIHDGLQALLAEHGERLDAVYACPHHPTEGLGRYKIVCECRKPKPGLIVQAQREWGLDLARSWCVGDMERDLAAGAAVGVPGILVATGKGAAEAQRMRAEGRPPRFFERNITDAVARILATSAQGR
ncbi:MAG: HAD family hydrolase [Planctomycetes bacterium]|nr:HAD family hydrolase [Planctomycetota bacterium]